MKKIRITALNRSKEIYVFPNIESLYIWQSDGRVGDPKVPCIDLFPDESAEIEWLGVELFEQKFSNDHRCAHLIRAARKRVPKNAHGAIVSVYAGYIEAELNLFNYSLFKKDLMIRKLDIDEPQLNFPELFRSEIKI